jgi:hypothetical protein
VRQIWIPEGCLYNLSSGGLEVMQRTVACRVGTGTALFFSGRAGWRGHTFLVSDGNWVWEP